MQTDVFISHASEDRTLANAICAQLEARRIRCWIAPRDVPAGSIWAEAIVTAIENTRVMVLLVSAHSIASRQVLNEVERAVSKGVIIVPFRLEQVTLSKSLEYFLGSRHWLDAIDPPVEKHVLALVDQLESILRDTPPPERKPEARPSAARRALMLTAAAAGAIALFGGGAWLWLNWNSGRGSHATPPSMRTETPSVARSAPPAEPASTPKAAEPSANLPRAGWSAAVPTSPPAAPAAPATSVARFDLLVVDSVWCGSLLDARGSSVECVLTLSRRTGDRLDFAVHFPLEEATNAVRWGGHLTGADVSLEGGGLQRARLSVAGRVDGGRFEGTWIDNGGRNGVFLFDQQESSAISRFAGSQWRLTLVPGNGADPIALSLRDLKIADTRVSGRCLLEGRRQPSTFVALVLGNRFFGALHNVVPQGNRMTAARFSAIVAVDGSLVGAWSSDAGVAGTLQGSPF